MKKSNYIGKYDFIAYYTKQPAFWFFSNAEVEAAIDAQARLADPHAHVPLDQADEEDDDVEEIGDEHDYYSLYKELKEENKNIDENNPQIVEGIIIDKKSRDYVQSLYPHITTVVDLEGSEYCTKTHEELSLITKHLIENNQAIIIFQPVFIADHLITKPDALVKEGDAIRIIETKGTTTAKRHHFLDLYFQSRVISRINYLEDY